MDFQANGFSQRTWHRLFFFITANHIWLQSALVAGTPQKHKDHLVIQKTRNINSCNPETLTSIWIPFGIGLVNLGMIFVFFLLWINLKDHIIGIFS